MRRLAMILAAAGLILGAGRVSVATVVVESISGSPGDWTYTYTLTNGGSGEIWMWAVWFPSDPNADLVTPLLPANWGATNLLTHGFFPEEYNAAWGTTVLDSASAALVGPNSEPGFYYTYASDFTSGNPGQYWNGSSWVNLPAPLPPFTDPIWDAEWRGEDYGWSGSGANMQTSYGIPSSGTGQFTVHSSATNAVGGPKSFSYSTTDYWYSRYDGTSDYWDFEGSGTVIPEPVSIVIWSLLSLVCVGAYRWRRRSGSVEFGGSRRPSRQPARQHWSEGTTEAILEIIERGRMKH